MSFAKILTRQPNTNGINGVGENGNSSSNGVSNTTLTTPSKVISGRRRFGENGFEEQGGYMAVKKAKLDNQFNKSIRAFGSEKDDESCEIFRGVSIYINGYTSPPEPELKELFMKHGGIFHPYRNSSTTFVVATNLSTSSKRLYGSKTIKPDWIMDSIAAGKALETRHYMLYDLNEEKNQMTLTQLMGGSKKRSTTPVVQNGTSKAQGTQTVKLQIPSVPLKSNSQAAPQVNGDSEEKDHVSESEDEEEFFECSQELFPSQKSQDSGSKQKHPQSYPNNSSTNGEHENGVQVNGIKVHEVTEVNGKEVNGVNGHLSHQADDEYHENGTGEVDQPQHTSPPKSFNGNVNGIENGIDHSHSPPKATPTTNKIKTATDDGFIEDFFGRSRLHLISEQKKEMQVLVGNLRKNLDSSNGQNSLPNLEKFANEVGESLIDLAQSPSEGTVVLMHIDLDCFFVSVGLLSRPHLRGKPVVVTHSSGKGQDSKSDIACASYEARKFGVKNGMWVGDAKQRCPELQVISYDFEEYKRISKLFFEAVASVTLDIEPCSVDEMIIDATSVLSTVPGATPENLASFLRKIILANTNCPASVGIGSSKLLAKLAVKMAKPDGIHHLSDEEAPAHIQALPVRDLPGVGWSNEDKLREKFGVVTCADLLRVPLKDLKSLLGDKTAEKMHSFCKGVDTTEMKYGFDKPKTVSVDVNFGIRFTSENDVTSFLINICKELSTRADRIGASSTHFSLKLLIRKKGAGEPLKQGGHGIVDSITRSRSLLTPTRNWQELYKTACSLTRLIRIPPTDYRGIGVTLSELTFDCDKTNKKSVQRTLTDMPISRAHKMLSILQKKGKVSTVSSSTSVTPEDLSLPSEPKSNNNLSGQQQDQTVPIVTVTDTSTSPVDIEVLRQLPREIAEEQCRFYGIGIEVLDEVPHHDNPVDSKSVDDAIESVIQQSSNGQGVTSYYDNIDTVDESFLQALPESVRQDVLIQLQEAKGRKTVNDNKFDEQQPCTSKQAIERDKKRLEELRRSNESSPTRKEEEELEFDSELNSSEPLHLQVTPKIKQDQRGENKLHKFIPNPVEFWDSDSFWQVIPSEPVTLPALNTFSEIADVRNLIRSGLEAVTNPTEQDVQSLEQYFNELLTRGFTKHTHVLMKFLYRKTLQLPDTSKWLPVLSKIIDDTQATCKKRNKGVFDLESE